MSHDTVHADLARAPGTDPIGSCATKNGRGTADALTPTDEVGRDLQYAYRYFNRHLFGNTLPHNIVLSYQRDSASFAYFRQSQYLDTLGRTSHTIVVNPQFLAVRTLTESLASLVHNMCRLAQRVSGKRPSRSTYHNRELAGVLKGVGLLPRVDGEPDGKETGHRVGHIAEGFAFTWIDREAPAVPHDATPEQARARYLEAAVHFTSNPSQSTDASGHPMRRPKPKLPDPVYAALQDAVDYAPVTPTGRRRKYECSGCKKVFWGGRDIDALCKRCDRPFLDTDLKSLATDDDRRRHLRQVRHQKRVKRAAEKNEARASSEPQR